jgi:hypothetical protein
MVGTYSVQRSLTIAADAERVYDLIVDFHRWTAWSPWEGLDPAMQRTYEGPASGPGAIYRWRGNRKAGQGRMQITDATPGSAVSIDLTFEKPFKSRSTTVFRLDSVPGGTTATWTMTGPKTLATRIMGLFTSMDKLIGPDFERGLAQLKTAAESPR